MIFARYGQFCTGLAAVVFSTMASAGIQAGTIAVDFSSLDGSASSLVGRSQGWKFDVNNTMEVTHLGFFDASGDGLAGSHEVGLFSSIGTPLVTGTVSTSDTLINSFRYVSIAPVTLSAGQSYVIAAEYNTNSDIYMNNAGGLSVDPNITLSEYRFSSSSNSSVIFPTEVVSSGQRFGPNFQFDLVVVPEPSTLILAALGFLAIRGRRRRK